MRSPGDAASDSSQQAEILSVEVERGLSLLLRAFAYAQQTNQSLWDFAVEISDLESIGLDRTDLRWLVCRGFVEHAHESAGSGEHHREFHPARRLSFSESSCFVLTQTGAEFARNRFTGSSASAPSQLSPSSSIPRGNGSNGLNRTDAPSASTGAGPPKPHWDAEYNELRLGDQVVKAYKLPSPNQETVLAAFEEDGWPPRIDDPLAPEPDIDPKRRLHDTIRSLNRNQKSKLLRFMGDGTGEGIRWSLVREEAEAE